MKFTRGQFVLLHKGSLKVRQVLDRAEPGATDKEKIYPLAIRGENRQETLTIHCYLGVMGSERRLPGE